MHVCVYRAPLQIKLNAEMAARLAKSSGTNVINDRLKEARNVAAAPASREKWPRQSTRQLTPYLSREGGEQVQCLPTSLPREGGEQVPSSHPSLGLQIGRTFRIPSDYGQVPCCSQEPRAAADEEAAGRQ